MGKDDKGPKIETPESTEAAGTAPPVGHAAPPEPKEEKPVPELEPVEFKDGKPVGNPKRTVETFGKALLGVRGFEADGKALFDLPRANSRAWLYNATRARLLWPSGLVLSLDDFQKAVSGSADVPMVGSTGRHTAAADEARAVRAAHVKGKKSGEKTPAGKVM